MVVPLSDPLAHEIKGYSLSVSVHRSALRQCEQPLYKYVCPSVDVSTETKRMMFWLIVLFIVVFTLLSLYVYVRWTYYTLHGPVRGLPPEFLFGNLRQLGIVNSQRQLLDSYIHGCEKLRDRFGDVFQFWMGANHCYVFCRPEHLEEIYNDRHRFERADIRTKTFGLIAENMIINLTGWKYKRHAKVVLPMLRKARFRSQTSLIVDCADQLVEIWRIRLNKSKKELICTSLVSDLQQLMLDTFTLLTFDYDFGNLKHLHRSALSEDTSSSSDVELTDLGQALTIWLDALKRVTINGMPAFINSFLLKFDPTYQQALKILENYARKIIVKCQENTDLNEKPTTLVASLVSALHKDEEGERNRQENEQSGLNTQELLDEVLGLILAGFETTSSVLSWIIFYVSQNLSIQQKMKDELKHLGISKDTPLDDFGLLDRCEYIQCVLKETFRIAPLVLGSFRTLTEDTNIDGIDLRRGETVVGAFSLIQRDPRFWKRDPEEFFPERFLSSEDLHPHLHSFGGGHRRCIGQDLARLELTLIVIRWMLFVTFREAPGNDGNHRQQMTVTPKHLAVFIEFDQ